MWFDHVISDLLDHIGELGSPAMRSIISNTWAIVIFSRLWLIPYHLIEKRGEDKKKKEEEFDPK